MELMQIHTIFGRLVLFCIIVADNPGNGSWYAAIPVLLAIWYTATRGNKSDK